MKIAYLILCHKNPNQVARLIDRLSSSRSYFYIHIDGKQHHKPFIELINSLKNPNHIFLVNDREQCNWGTFSLVKATLNGLNQILLDPQIDYIVLLSGQDYPIKSINYIENFYENHLETIFLEYHTIPFSGWYNQGISRFPKFYLINKIIQLYGGSQWWSIPSKFGRYFINELKSKNFSRLEAYFKKVKIPDESFFHTTFLNLPEYSIKIINDNLRYIDWLKPTPPYPSILKVEDYTALQNTPALFARKFDEGVDKEILEIIDEQIIDQ